MFKRKPTIKNASTRELFEELAIRLKDSGIWLYDIQLVDIFKADPPLLSQHELDYRRGK